MATIDFRGWRLESDSSGWACGKPRTRHTKAGQLEIFLYQPSYYPTLEAALQGLLKREIRESDASSVQEILALIKQVQADIKELVDA